MESSSAPAHRRHDPCWRILAAVSLLTMWVTSVSPKVTVEVIPPKPVEGQDVLLKVHDMPSEVEIYSWNKGKTVRKSHLIVLYLSKERVRFNGSEYNNRQTLFHNGSLLIENTTREDAGHYIFEIIRKHIHKAEVRIWLQIHYGPDAPTISPSVTYYFEGTSFDQSCHAVSNPPAQYSWLFNGKPLQVTQGLFKPSISVNDSGSYTCQVHNAATGINRTIDKIITVFKSVSQPSVRTSTPTVKENDTLLIFCFTEEYMVSYRWFFNGRMLQPTERIKLFSVDHIVSIRPARKEDAGEYQCMISNPFSSSKSEPLKVTVN